MKCLSASRTSFIFILRPLSNHFQHETLVSVTQHFMIYNFCFWEKISKSLSWNSSGLEFHFKGSFLAAWISFKRRNQEFCTEGVLGCIHLTWNFYKPPCQKISPMCGFISKHWVCLGRMVAGRGTPCRAQVSAPVQLRKELSKETHELTKCETL